MAVKNEGFPDLERYLEERGRHLVTYTEGGNNVPHPLLFFCPSGKGSRGESSASKNHSN